eukprot:jgi/Mesvir1/16022/Mv08318-RA.1
MEETSPSTPSTVAKRPFKCPSYSCKSAFGTYQKWIRHYNDQHTWMMTKEGQDLVAAACERASSNPERNPTPAEFANRLGVQRGEETRRDKSMHRDDIIVIIE